MKRIIYEQQNQVNVRRLAGDKTWEYGLVNGLWAARRQNGNGKWISIDPVDPNANDKVKNPDAVNLLNDTFSGDAKLRNAEIAKLNSTKTSTGQSTNKLQPTTQPGLKKPSAKLPTDYNKNISFLFGDKTSVTLAPQFKNISKSLIDSLGLGDKGNLFTLPNNVMKKVCPRNVSIFTPDVMAAKHITQNDINNWCDRDTNWKNSTGAIQIPKEAYGAAPTFQTGTVTTNPVQESELKSLIKKVLRESFTPKIELKKK